jgi:hypothetical protein
LGDPGAAVPLSDPPGSPVLDGAEDKRALLFFFGDAGAANEITLLADDDSGTVAEGCSCSSVEPPLRSSSNLILCGVGGD